MIEYYKTLCLLDSGLITPYHAAFTRDSTHEISAWLRYIGTGFIFCTGDNRVPYTSEVRYRFYISRVPTKVRRSKKLYKDLINELRNHK